MQASVDCHSRAAASWGEESPGTWYVGGWVGHGGGEKGIVWPVREVEPRFLSNLFRAATIALTDLWRFAH